MTDQTLANKVRAWVNSWETTRPEHRTLEDAEDIIQALRDLIPAPTLADMTSEERDGCERMQCDVGGEDARAVIFNPHWEDGSAHVLWPSGFSTYPGWERVTPRPDLPRLEWPGDKKPDPAPTLPDGWWLADHKDYGRVIVTSPTPDGDGHVYFVLPDDDLMGYDWHFCRPDVLTYIVQEADQ